MGAIEIQKSELRVEDTPDTEPCAVLVFVFGCSRKKQQIRLERQKKNHRRVWYGVLKEKKVFQEECHDELCQILLGSLL